MEKNSNAISRRTFIERTGTVATGLTILSGTITEANNLAESNDKDRCAFIYKTPSGTLKDNMVIWHNGTFYLFTMYGKEDQKG